MATWRRPKPTKTPCSIAGPFARESALRPYARSRKDLRTIKSGSRHVKGFLYNSPRSGELDPKLRILPGHSLLRCVHLCVKTLNVKRIIACHLPGGQLAYGGFRKRRPAQGSHGDKGDLRAATPANFGACRTTLRKTKLATRT